MKRDRERDRERQRETGWVKEVEGAIEEKKKRKEIVRISKREKEFVSFIIMIKINLIVYHNIIRFDISVNDSMLM